MRGRCGRYTVTGSADGVVRLWGSADVFAAAQEAGATTSCTTDSVPSTDSALAVCSATDEQPCAAPAPGGLACDHRPYPLGWPQGRSANGGMPLVGMLRISLRAASDCSCRPGSDLASPVVISAAPFLCIPRVCNDELLLRTSSHISRPGEPFWQKAQARRTGASPGRLPQCGGLFAGGAKRRKVAGAGAGAGVGERMGREMERALRDFVALRTVSRDPAFREDCFQARSPPLSLPRLSMTGLLRRE